jgi:diacylglycerol kinase family enzyme
VRGLLIVNPKATSTNERARRAIAATLRHEIDLEVETTTSRGHATELARSAAADGVDVVVVLGGDGTINEVVNGLLGPEPPSADELPLLALLPGGHANVLAGALGLERDPQKAAHEAVRLLSAGSIRTIGLGTAGSRWFTFNAGLGIDAEVVATVEDLRHRGLAASSATYVAGAVKTWVSTQRWSGPMAIDVEGNDGTLQQLDGVVFAIVQNTAPWTMLGERPLQASPGAHLDRGLDLVALASLSTPTTVRTLGSMLIGKGVVDGPDTTVVQDLRRIRIRSSRPMPLQVDGDLLGETDDLVLESHERALRVLSRPEV